MMAFGDELLEGSNGILPGRSITNDLRISSALGDALIPLGHPDMDEPAYLYSQDIQAQAHQLRPYIEEYLKSIGCYGENVFENRIRNAWLSIPQRFREKVSSTVAKFDGKSWTSHSAAQLAEYGSVAHELNYKLFADLRTPVDAFQTGIPLKFGRYSAKFLTNSAIFHDVAEDPRSKQNATSSFYWKQVSKGLKGRALVPQIAHGIQMAFASEVLRGLHSLGHPLLLSPSIVAKSEDFGSSEVMSRLTKYNPSHDILNWMELNRHFFRKDISIATLNKRADIISFLEMHQWRAHHERNYPEFAYWTFELLRAIGYNSSSALIATAFLMQACKGHDIAETLEEKRKVLQKELDNSKELQEGRNALRADLDNRIELEKDSSAFKASSPPVSRSFIISLDRKKEVKYYLSVPSDLHNIDDLIKAHWQIAFGYLPRHYMILGNSH